MTTNIDGLAVTIVESETHQAYILREANSLDLTAVETGQGASLEKGDVAMTDWCKDRKLLLRKSQAMHGAQAFEVFMDSESYIIFRMIYGEAAE